jgi:nicotinamide mononucleotide transporter
MLETAFNFYGTAISWLEAVAFVLAIVNVILNVREVHWAWPLAIISSALYVWLFYVSKLYGETGLNVFFAISAAWGWWQWLFGHRSVGTAPLSPVRMPLLRGWVITVAAWAVLWLGIGLFLRAVTDNDALWIDAFATSGSVVGTVLLARKYIENWPVWLVVNAVSIALFIYKSLLLTALLYIILFVLAVWGWRAWHVQISKPEHNA